MLEISVEEFYWGVHLGSTFMRGMEAGLDKERILQPEQNLSLKLGCPSRAGLRGPLCALISSVRHCTQVLTDGRHVLDINPAETHQSPHSQSLRMRNGHRPDEGVSATH